MAPILLPPGYWIHEPLGLSSITETVWDAIGEHAAQIDAALSYMTEGPGRDVARSLDQVDVDADQIFSSLLDTFDAIDRAPTGSTLAERGGIDGLVAAADRVSDLSGELPLELLGDLGAVGDFVNQFPPPDYGAPPHAVPAPPTPPFVRRPPPPPPIPIPIVPIPGIPSGPFAPIAPAPPVELPPEAAPPGAPPEGPPPEVLPPEGPPPEALPPAPAPPEALPPAPSPPEAGPPEGPPSEAVPPAPSPPEAGPPGEQPPEAAPPIETAAVERAPAITQEDLTAQLEELRRQIRSEVIASADISIILS